MSNQKLLIFFIVKTTLLFLNSIHFIIKILGGADIRPSVNYTENNC